MSRRPRALMLVAMGFEVAFLVVASLLIGRWADEQLGSSPLALLVGLILGCVGALLRMMSYLKLVGREGEGS